MRPAARSALLAALALGGVLLLAPLSPAADRCGGCARALEGEIVVVEGLKFHPECFRCDRCERPIRGAYVKRDSEGGGDAQFLHPECARAALPLCDQCGRPIEDAFIQDGEARYHESCYREHVALRCARCRTPIEGPYYTQEGRPYCAACFAAYVAPRCVVCGEAILDREYPLNFWKEACHTACSPRMRECDVCDHAIEGKRGARSRQLPDGRSICTSCVAGGITDAAEGRQSLEAVAREMAVLGFAVETKEVGLELCGHDRLQALSGSPRTSGHTTFEGRLVNGVMRQETVTIHVLSHLVGARYDGVAAHELTHVYLHRRVAKQIPSFVEEGFCNYVASLVLRRRSADLARYQLQAMEIDTDPDYGDGYRRVRRWVEGHSVDALLAALEKGQVPPGL